MAGQLSIATFQPLTRLHQWLPLRHRRTARIGQVLPVHAQAVAFRPHSSCVWPQIGVDMCGFQRELLSKRKKSYSFPSSFPSYNCHFGLNLHNPSEYPPLTNHDTMVTPSCCLKVVVHDYNQTGSKVTCLAEACPWLAQLSTTDDRKTGSVHVKKSLCWIVARNWLIIELV